MLEGQPFIDEQDELSVTEFMRQFGMPDRINEEIFVAMAKALDFIDPDGNQPERLCRPLQQYIEDRGGLIVADEYISAMPVDIMK
eukprot:gene35444-45928_t